jgi:hypothetical protein
VVLHRHEPRPAVRVGSASILANCHAYMLDAPM